MKNEDFYSEPYKPKESWTVNREFKPSYDMVGVQGFEPWTPKLVSLERFELSPHGPKPCTLPDYAIESLFFHSLM